MLYTNILEPTKHQPDMLHSSCAILPEPRPTFYRDREIFERATSHIDREAGYGTGDVSWLKYGFYEEGVLFDAFTVLGVELCMVPEGLAALDT